MTFEQFKEKTQAAFKDYKENGNRQECQGKIAEALNAIGVSDAVSLSIGWPTWPC